MKNPATITTALCGLVLSGLCAASARGFDAPEDRPPSPAAADGASAEFFEKSVRPLLVERCQTCHGSSKQKGGLRLDSRAGAVTGGASGAAVIPGKPGESLLIDAVNYGDVVQMPPKSKLAAAEINILKKWVEIGAPWPGGTPNPHAGDAKPGAVKPFDLEARKRHWSFQPIRDVPPPEVKQRDWPRGDVDRFLLAALEAKGLAPAPAARRDVWLRRVTFDLVGLPPTPSEIEAFARDKSPRAYERVVDRLLASPHYGERWGRHWFDLVRFAETYGHEFDYNILDAWRYRYYVIRAFNDDVPYDQFVVEHVAGDLLASPRRHPTEGFNESVIATGYALFGEGTHSPVDVLEDGLAHKDNQIDVFSKTFLGLTVACARCHDHKFDAITTKDYYALAGYFWSARHQYAFIDAPARIANKAAELSRLESEILDAIPPNRSRAAATSPATRPPANTKTPVAARTPTPARPTSTGTLFEDFSGAGYDGWSVVGDAFGAGPTRPGARLLRLEAEPAVVDVASGVAHSGLTADKLHGALRSRTFTIEKPFIHYRAWGRGGRVHLVVESFEKIRDPIYGVLMFNVDHGDQPRWIVQNASMWKGRRAYIELSDGGTADFRPGQTMYTPGDGYLAVDEIRFDDDPRPAADQPGAAAQTLNADTSARLRAALKTDANLAPKLERAKALAASIPPPTLVPALLEGTRVDQRVHVRGNPKTLGELVPRRFLTALGGENRASDEHADDRLDLARRLVDPSNPLTARVIVNRVWLHHFGRGLVATPDDFGVMGRAPSHPALLDHLASDFMRNGWSIKRLHRALVLSSAYRMSSVPVAGAKAERVDPSNELLHRMNLRRLEAEEIRDAMLAVSGRLDAKMFGPSVPPHLTSFMEGRGRPGSSGPLDGDGRRSIYINVRRNFLTPMLLAFDMPTPFSTMGRRNASNVPAQSLTMLNDPFVIAQADLWARRLLADRAATSPRERVRRAFWEAFARAPDDLEIDQALEFVRTSTSRPDDPRGWAALCHVLFNVKEFIYVD